MYGLNVVPLTPQLHHRPRLSHQLVNFLLSFCFSMLICLYFCAQGFLVCVTVLIAFFKTFLQSPRSPLLLPPAHRPQPVEPYYRLQADLDPMCTSCTPSSRSPQPKQRILTTAGKAKSAELSRSPVAVVPPKISPAPQPCVLADFLIYFSV